MTVSLFVTRTFDHRLSCAESPRHADVERSYIVSNVVQISLSGVIMRGSPPGHMEGKEKWCQPGMVVVGRSPRRPGSLVFFWDHCRTVAWIEVQDGFDPLYPLALQSLSQVEVMCVRQK